MDVTLNWLGRMTFEGVGPSGFVQRLDTDPSTGGENSGARPMEMIAIGLAGCTAMDVLSILSKMQQSVTEFQVKFHGDRAREHPRVFTDSVIEYHVYGTNVNEAGLVHAIELSVEKYCPAYAMLIKAFPIRLTYKLYDSKSKVLLREGEYIHKQQVA